MPNAPAASGPHEPIDPRTRQLIWILVLGAMAPALDTTIVNVALPALGRGLGTSVGATQWTITGYLLAMAMAMPLTRWISERYGRKQVWLAALAVFAIGSVSAGAAWNIDSLIVFRVVQGAAGGVMIPLMTTMMVTAAGSGRLGRMMTTAMMLIVVVPVFGPVAGGLIVKYLGWRWVFYINPPICAVAMWLAWRRVPTGTRHPGRSLDLVGLGLLSPGLALTIYGLSGASGSQGFGGTRAWVPLAAGVVLCVVFARHAWHRADNPLINVRLLRVRTYRASAAVLFLAGLSVYGPLLLLSLYFQEVQGHSAVLTGLLLAPQGIGSLVPRQVAGNLTDRIGARPVAYAGLFLTAIGTLAFAFAGPNSNEWLLAASLFVRGAGLAPVTIAVQAGAFTDIDPTDVPDASSTTRIAQQLGGSFGAAVLALILTNALAHHAATAAGRGLAFTTAFWWALGLGALALLPALGLPAKANPTGAPGGSTAPPLTQTQRRPTATQGQSALDDVAD